MASVRFNVTFSPDVFERVNSYCKSSGIPRSAFCSWLLVSIWMLWMLCLV